MGNDSARKLVFGEPRAQLLATNPEALAKCARITSRPLPNAEPNMVVSKLLSKAGLRPQAKARIAVEAIDRELDVPTSQFARRVSKLIRNLRAAGTDVDVAAYRAKMAVSANLAGESASDSRGGFYQVEIRRIPAMDRDEEFRMARRYELLRQRLEHELVALRLDREVAHDLAGRPASEVLAHLTSVGVDLAADAYPMRCLRQLEELRNLYVEGSLHIVMATVNRYRGLGVDTADLIQEGNASLFQAIEGFDWRRDVRFRTYAQYWVHQAVLKLLYNTARTVRIPIWVQKVLGKIRRAQDELRRAGHEPTHAEIAQRLGLPVEKIDWVLATKRYAVSIDAEAPSGEGATLAQQLPDPAGVDIVESIPEGDLRQTLAEVLDDLPAREQMILRRRFGLDGQAPETLGEIAAGMGITAERVRQLQNAAIGRMQRPRQLDRLKAFVENA